MFATAISITTLAALVSLASAQGIVSLIRSGTTATRGPDPSPAFALSSAIRRVSTVNPITDVTSSGMTCGPGSQTAQAQFKVPSAGAIQFFWTGALGADGNRPNWNSTVGPILTYITPCTRSCSAFDPTNAPWFKVDQQGQVSGNASQWVQSDLTINHPPSITIPNVPNGDYLMRNEVIVLSNAATLGGAQFYVSCSQLTVAGADKTASLPASSLGVKFPGAYSASDPGILVPDLNATDFVYPFPGGDVLTFGGVSSNSLAATAAANATSTASALPSNATATTALTAIGTTTDGASITTSTIVPDATAALTSTATTDVASTVTTLPTGSATAVLSSAVAANAVTTTTKTKAHTNPPHTRTTPGAGAATATTVATVTATGVVPPASVTVTGTDSTGATGVAAAAAAATTTGTANPSTVVGAVFVTVTATETATVTVTPTTAAQATSAVAAAADGSSVVGAAKKVQTTVTRTITATAADNTATTTGRSGAAAGVRRRHHWKAERKH